VEISKTHTSPYVDPTIHITLMAGSSVKLTIRSAHSHIWPNEHISVITHFVSYHPSQNNVSGQQSGHNLIRPLVYTASFDEIPAMPQSFLKCKDLRASKRPPALAKASKLTVRQTDLRTGKKRVSTSCHGPWKRYKINCGMPTNKNL